jgi:hypothetical protein
VLYKLTSWSQSRKSHAILPVTEDLNFIVPATTMGADLNDLAPLLSSMLQQKHATKPIAGPRDLSEKLDSFLSEAYQINNSISSLLSDLRQIRQPYLSTAPPPRRITTSSNTYFTDRDRENIDSSTGHLLREINANITKLTEAAELNAATTTARLERKYGKPSGLLWKWAAGEGDVPDAGKSEEQLDDEGRAMTVKNFRKGVLWYLTNQLSQAATKRQQMVEIRLEREREKERSVLYKNKTAQNDMSDGWDSYGNMDMRGRSTYNPALDGETGVEAQLTPEQLRVFEKENSTLLNHYNDTLQKVTQAEKSLLEISSLQETLVGHLSTQGEMIEQLVTDVANTDENLRKGNTELKRASERSSTAKTFFWSSAVLCAFLVIWDLVI